MNAHTNWLTERLRNIIEATIDYASACQDMHRDDALKAGDAITSNVKELVEHSTGGFVEPDYLETFIPDLNGAHEMKIHGGREG